MKHLRLLPILVFAVTLTACGDDPASSNASDPVVASRVTDLPSDPFVAFVEGRPVGAGVYTFYSLREDRIVAREDSATTQWDVAFKGSTILVNGGVSGPGQGEGQILETTFANVTEAPATGYTTDAVNGPALGTGSGQSWYSYNPATQVLAPTPGRVLVVKTADGRYAKLNMISYYQGAPAEPSAASTARYLTFDFVFQPDGTRSFE